jgi:hypothetical protein
MYGIGKTTVYEDSNYFFHELQPISPFDQNDVMSKISLFREQVDLPTEPSGWQNPTAQIKHI